MNKCEYCGIDSETPACDSCKRWNMLCCGKSEKQDDVKPSPFIANSRGLHEKYFQDSK